MNDKEVLQMALDALDSDSPDIQLRAATTLRARLTQREEKPEPVAKVRIHKTGGNAGISWSSAPVNDFDSLPLLQDGALLYTAPPKREWVGLTDEEIRNEAKNHVFDESFFSGAIWARGKMMGKNYD